MSFLIARAGINDFLSRCAVALTALLIALFAWPQLSSAHEMSTAELNMREFSKGRFVWAWGPGATSRPVAADLTPVWPEGCFDVPEEQSLRCSRGLNGKVSVDGIGKRYSAAMLRVTWLDGETRVYTITTAQPSIQLYGAASDQRGSGEVVTAYTVLGIEHILSGIDHLLFVIGLLFLVGFNRRLVWTITAFTVAHSLTLASSVLGLLTLRPGPVETAIALSIVLVAIEALRRQDTLARQWPAMVAFLFGLVHGLGFAGALKEIGLPSNYLPLALFTFNVGVEIGQLATVALAYGLVRAFSRFHWFQAGRVPALYAIGIVASYWSWSRLAGMATGLV